MKPFILLLKLLFVKKYSLRTPVIIRDWQVALSKVVYIFDSSN